jgi:hypothetical protein
MIKSSSKIISLTVIASIGLLALSSTMLNELQIDATTDNGECDSSYPDTCIPSPPPNLNCGDISDKRFEVLSPDPHGFDRDEDGIGCES